MVERLTRRNSIASLKVRSTGAEAVLAKVGR
jgi:hypothetical protein